MLEFKKIYQYCQTPDKTMSNAAKSIILFFNFKLLPPVFLQPQTLKITSTRPMLSLVPKKNEAGRNRAVTVNELGPLINCANP